MQYFGAYWEYLVGNLLFMIELPSYQAVGITNPRVYNKYQKRGNANGKQDSQCRNVFPLCTAGKAGISETAEKISGAFHLVSQGNGSV